MVKDHSDSEKGNPMQPQGFFYMHHPTDRITHTTVFVTPVVEHWLERELQNQYLQVSDWCFKEMTQLISAVTDWGHFSMVP